MHITKKQKQKIIELHQDGYSVRRISRELKIARSTISLLIRNYATNGDSALERKLQNRRYTPEEKIEIINRYLNGETMISLSLIYGIPSGAGLISAWVKKYLTMGYNGINVRQGRPRLIMKEKKQVPEKITVDEKKRLKQLEQENLQLRAENAYLKKLEALIQSRPEQHKKKR